MMVRFITFFSRGNNHQNIFIVDDDRHLFLDTIGQISERFDNEIFAYVLMDTIICYLFIMDFFMDQESL